MRAARDRLALTQAPHILREVERGIPQALEPAQMAPELILADGNTLRVHAPAGIAGQQPMIGQDR